jgi:electron transfer flavoprotein-quinone oxidoreductase
MPTLVTDGMLVAGDAAALCLAAGLWLEGVNFAMGSGLAAGQTVDDALRTRDTSAVGLAGYRQRLESSFVLADHRKLRDVPHLVLSDRVQRRYPAVACHVVERLFRVDNPRPKPGLFRILLEEIKRAGLRWRDMARDAWRGGKALG